MLYLVVGLVILLLVVRFIAQPSGANHSYDEDRTYTMEDVKQFIRDGNKISAIKAYRHIHQVGLKEAKEAVEALDTTI